jgi:Tfp pilus assembly protein PilV
MIALLLIVIALLLGAFAVIARSIAQDQREREALIIAANRSRNTRA